jgi:hypothetical protein
MEQFTILFQDRQYEKQVSRDADAQDMGSGKKSRQQLRHENGWIKIMNIDYNRVKVPK